MINAKKIIINIVKSGFEGDFKRDLIRKTVIINLFTIVGTIAALTYSIIGFAKSLSNYSIVIFLFIITTIINALYLRKSKNINCAGKILVFLMYLLLVYLYTTKYLDVTIIFWYYIYPILALFILGRKNGFWSIVILLITILILMQFDDLFDKTLSTEAQVRFFITFTVLAVFAYIYEITREISYNKFIKAEKAQSIYLKKVENQKKEISNQNKKLKEQNYRILITQEELIQQNEEIAVQKEQLQDNNHKINKQNEYIKSGIKAAVLLQQTILPEQNHILKYFKSFIIYIPKDIVSGDFYWFYQIKNYSFIAVIDCTGHGVSGAFMSVIGYQILNEIIIENSILDPKTILENLNDKVRKALKQDTTDNHDGMELALCRLEKIRDNYELVFSGAKSPIVLYSQNISQLIKIKGSRKSIGGFLSFNNISFKNEIRTINKNDIIYLYTDGIVDQNNYNRNRFGTKRLYKLLSNITSLPLVQQKLRIIDAINKWKDEEPIRDDITIIGIKIS